MERRPHLAAAARTAIALLTGVDWRQAPRGSAELDALGKPELLDHVPLSHLQGRFNVLHVDAPYDCGAHRGYRRDYAA
jgi:hypothetical protein